MNKKNIKIFLIVILIILCFFSKIPSFIINYMSGEASYKYYIDNIIFRIFEDKNEKKINDSKINYYINEKYNNISNDFKKDYIGIFSNSDIRGVHGWHYRSWLRAYEIKAPFMEKCFEVWIDNRTHEIFGDNFYEVLSTDPKFNHLYSNWIKRQIGCEDENVELVVSFNMNDFDFTKITGDRDVVEQIFENINKFSVVNVYVKNVNIDFNDEEAIKEYAKEIRRKYYCLDDFEPEDTHVVFLIKDNVDFYKEGIRKSFIFLCNIGYTKAIRIDFNGDENNINIEMNASYD